MLILGISLADYFGLTATAQRATSVPLTGAAVSLPDFIPAALRFAPSFVHIDAAYAASDSEHGENLHAPLPGASLARRGVGSGIIIHRAGTS